MERQRTTYRSLLLLATAVLLWSSAAAAGELTSADYLYRLSTFTGTAALGAWPRLTVDASTNEIYVLTDGEISIFNQRGMEIYRFARSVDEQAEGPTIIDLAVKKDGAMILITQSYRGGRLNTEVVAANYRGEPVSPFVLKDLPPGLSGFRPLRVIACDGLLYFANLSEMKILVVGEDGSFRQHYDIQELLRNKVDERKGKGKLPQEVELEVNDFSVDREGNILFAVPVVGDAFRLSPDLRLDRISTRGSGPGKFGIPAAVVADGKGNYLVSDMLRSVVMVFDRNFAYRGAFGGRHAGPDALAVPRNLVIDANNRLYVSQTEKMGVSVFQLTYN